MKNSDSFSIDDVESYLKDKLKEIQFESAAAAIETMIEEWEYDPPKSVAQGLTILKKTAETIRAAKAEIEK